MKNLIKLIFRKFGFEISKRNLYSFDYKWLKDYNIESIIDVGANQGQFAILISKYFPKAKIYSFEPITEVYERLLKNVDGLNILPFNLGLGDKEEIKTINHWIQGDASSSILEMSNIHIRNFPHVKNSISENIAITTLNDFFSKNDIDSNIYLKIDVQGFEDRVLSGGNKILSKIKIIQVESSFVSLYNDQKLFDYIFTYLTNNNFDFVGVADVIFDKDSGIPLFCDAFYINKQLK